MRHAGSALLLSDERCGAHLVLRGGARRASPRARARGAGRPAPPAGQRGLCTAGLRPFSADAAPGARRRLFHSARCRRSVWCYVSWNRPKGPWGSARGSGNAGDQAGQAACSFAFNPCVPLSLTEIIMSPILFVVYMSKMF